ncbi:hypothetical protein EU537_08755 [Candidatus Thorarchaeota archaeon]|nr:MAG: hypothetical protein EU537_08755 [Candidatus Thorarchaeota archaeon]
MVEIHLYGRLRQFIPDSRANEDTILYFDLDGECTLQELLSKLHLKTSDVGDCFINAILAEMNDQVRNDDSVGLFPFNMRLIDGGMHLKHHPNLMKIHATVVSKK